MRIAQAVRRVEEHLMQVQLAYVAACKRGDLRCRPQAPLPLLDGHRDEQFLRSPAQPVARAIRGGVQSPADLSAESRALHDGSYLYLVVEVSDDRIATDSDHTTPWDDDAVELFLDGDGSGGANYVGIDDMHLIFRPNDRSFHLGLRSAPVQSTAAAVVTTVHEGSYVLEVCVSWPAVHSTRYPGKSFRMEVQVDDDDDGGPRDAKSAWWSDDDEAWQSPDRFGRVRLGTRLADDERRSPRSKASATCPGAHELRRAGLLVVQERRAAAHRKPA